MATSADSFDMSAFADDKLKLETAVPPSGHSVVITENDPYGLTHNIVTRTGWAYGSGILMGGIKGIFEGYNDAKKTPAIFNNSRLLRNSIVNGMGRSGASLANHCGCFAIAYSLGRQYVFTKYPNDPYVADAIGAGVACGFMSLYKGPLTATAMLSLGTVVSFGIFKTLHKFGLLDEDASKKFL